MEKANETVGKANQLVGFGEAIKALKEGKRVRRNYWRKEAKFIFEQVPSIVGKDIVPKMTSLPQSVKNYFAWTFTEESNEQISEIYYSNQIALVGASNMVTGWSPSIEDSLATDWIILD